MSDSDDDDSRDHASPPKHKRMRTKGGVRDDDNNLKELPVNIAKATKRRV